MRWALDIAYRGSRYAGWQAQDNANTVQAELDKSLSTVLRSRIETVGAGRTDTGVHAEQLIVHFDYAGELNATLLHRLNGVLPYDIAVKALFKARRPDFHARFDAIQRSYRYQLTRSKSPILHDLTLWVKQPLSLEKMQAAAAILPEYSDFAAFCKAHGNNLTTLCTVYDAHWEVYEHIWHFHISANRFLRGMVRAIVGTLLLVGTEKISLETFREMVASGDRSKTGPNVGPQGLFLTEVRYSPNELIEVDHY